MSETKRTVDWSERTKGYLQEMVNPYHAHRREVLEAMIPENALQRDMKIYDFGCGDGSFFPRFLDSGADVIGSDIEASMIEIARKRLAQSHGLSVQSLKVGGVDLLSDLPTGSIDGMMALNVLAYLNPAEERTFYLEASRLIRNGGWLLVSHSNQLFDLYSMNRYTLNFIRDNLLTSTRDIESLPSLLLKSDEPQGLKALPHPIRENPLNYGLKLQKYGFLEARQEFINRHEAPPPILRKQRFPSTLDLSPEDRWKLLFVCSTFASLSIRRTDNG